MTGPGKRSSGNKAKLVRDKKGTLSQIRGNNYAGVSGETLSDDARVATAANKGSRDFGGLAPRVGGSFKPSGPAASGTAKKSTVKKSIKAIKRSAASPQAKRSAKRNARF